LSFLTVSQKGYLDAEVTQQIYIDLAMDAYSKAKAEIDQLLKSTYAKLAGTDPINYYAEMVKYDRYTKLSEEITSLYKAVAKEAGKATEKGLAAAMTENYNRQQYLSNWLAPINATPINPLLVRYSVTGNVDIWKEIQKTALDKMHGPLSLYTPQAGTLTSLLTKNYTAELDRILQAVQNGFITGKSYVNQVASIKDIIGKYVKGTDKATGAMYNALRIARTEGQRVLNVGALANSYVLKGQGIDVKKRWLAASGSRTRESHSALNGQTKELDELFVSPITGATGQCPGQMSTAADTINCRCTTIDIIEDFEPEINTAVNPLTGEEEPVTMKYYEDWAKDNGLI
jgi:hypothetical protein